MALQLQDFLSDYKRTFRDCARLAATGDDESVREAFARMQTMEPGLRWVRGRHVELAGLADQMLRLISTIRREIGEEPLSHGSRAPRG